ncbi:MAG: DUF1579 family protein [Bryobacteraceae bacterium]
MFAIEPGRWAGKSRLYLEGAAGPHSESDSTLEVAAGVNPTAREIRYGWSHEGQPQRGVLLIAAHPKDHSVTAAWLDSWHQGVSVMFSSGEAAAHGFSVRGSYAVPGHPDWFWRIAIEAAPDRLRLTMYNISPDGEEHLAVSADYSPA